MKKKDLRELKTKPKEELQKMAEETREKLRATKQDVAAGKTNKVSEIRKLKTDIARMLTLIHEKAK